MSVAPCIEADAPRAQTGDPMASKGGKDGEDGEDKAPARPVTISRRRAHEYDHHYGLRHDGRPADVPKTKPTPAPGGKS
jgi:hypothetical protein